jgi:hypothetical protein
MVKLMNRKERKEFLKYQIVLSDKNPTFMNKISQEKKVEDKFMRFTKLMDPKKKQTHNMKIEDLHKNKKTNQKTKTLSESIKLL